MNGPSIRSDMETDREMEVTPDYGKKEYREKSFRRATSSISAIAHKPRRAWAKPWMMTDRPLDCALREYLNLRRARK